MMPWREIRNAQSKLISKSCVSIVGIVAISGIWDTELGQKYFFVFLAVL
ncbi:MAG: hypothetical protein HRT44_06645, partial [Bdellovibrionales bacterium]|nr:hypothetical protein [Bdellovibrionales bacterium]